MAETGLIGPAAAPDLHVMSLNVRRRLPHLRREHPDRWQRRAPLVAGLLTAERPTVLGVQEALPDQRDALLDALGSEYRCVGVGRNAAGGDESCPIYWHSGRLELLGWRQTALSDSPETPGSRSWGNPIARIAVTADFRDAATGDELRAINTHLDPFSQTSRVRSASAIRELVESGARATAVTGDFNSRTGSATHRALLEGGLLRDSGLPQISG